MPNSLPTPDPPVLSMPEADDWAEKIYWPVTKIGPNRLDDPNVKLQIDDDERIEFIYI